MIFSFGLSERERIEVDVLRYERSPVGDVHDDNWLSVSIRVRAGGFQGNADAAILTWELVKLASDLRPLVDKLSGAAEFLTLEEQLSFNLEGKGKGHFDFHGEVLDQAGMGNRLRFTLKFDRSSLDSSLRELEAVIVKFPQR
jgi:hypothetical protein